MARLDPSKPIKPGVFTIWVIARSAVEAAALEKMSKAETSWKVLTSAVSGGYNLFGGSGKTGLKLVFPPSRKVGGVWVPRKGFDKTPPREINAAFGAMYFLVEFQQGGASPYRPATNQNSGATFGPPSSLAPKGVK